MTDIAGPRFLSDSRQPTGGRPPHPIGGNQRRPSATARLAEMSAIVITELAGLALADGWRRLRHRQAVDDAPRRLRRGLERLGPTFVKLGQFLSAKPDFLPDRYRAALAGLRDDTVPVPADAARRVVESAYGLPLAEVFAEFNNQPVAAASIGQVHQAVLPDGREVAVKVQRPGIRKVIETDIRLLTRAASITGRVPTLRPLQLPALLVAFAGLLLGELDYQREAADASTIREQLKRLDWLTVPAVVSSLCRTDILVMDFVHGIALSDDEGLAQAGLSRPELGTKVVAVNLHLLLFCGRFHADPHIGNYLVTSDGTLVMLDFGEVGRSTPSTRRDLGRLLAALIAHDHEQAGTALASLCQAPPSTAAALGATTAELVTDAHSRIGEIRIGSLLHGLLASMSRTGLTIPTDLGLIAKAIVECESTAEQLDARLQVDQIVGFALGMHARAVPTPTPAIAVAS